jgi:hypothetical protein
MSVRETATSVTVLWQDGTSTTERTINLILFINIDEYSCWPGDHVLFKGGEEGEKVAIVQRVSTERTAEIQLIGTEVSLSLKLCGVPIKNLMLSVFARTGRRSFDS